MTVVTRTRWRGALSLILAPLAIGLVSSPGFAKKARHGGNAEIAACVTNYKSGLDQEKSGHLLEARELFIRCSKSACGSPLREECTTRFTQLSVDIPSVVPVVTNAAGKPETAVDVKVDGEPLTSTLDGHSFILNPGAHEFSFSKDGHIFATQSLMIVQGQRNRLLSASLEPPEPASGKRAQRQNVAATSKAVPAAVVAQASDNDTGERTAVMDLSARNADESQTAQKDDAAQALKLTAADQSQKSRIPMLSYIFAGTGVAALGAGALLTVWGRSDTTKLNVCSPGCQQSSADHIHTLYVASDVSIGVGVAALAASYWAYAHSRSSQEGKEEETALRTPSATIGLQPASSGALGTLSGSF